MVECLAKEHPQAASTVQQGQQGEQQQAMASVLLSREEKTKAQAIPHTEARFLRTLLVMRLGMDVVR